MGLRKSFEEADSLADAVCAHAKERENEGVLRKPQRTTVVFVPLAAAGGGAMTGSGWGSTGKR